jgi:nucleoside-diphosphate-sugar epimerase
VVRDLEIRQAQQLEIKEHKGRAKDRLGFRPVFDLAGGLADTVRWWRTRSA